VLIPAAGHLRSPGSLPVPARPLESRALRYSLFLGLALVVVVLAGPPAAAQTPRAERPIYSVGDQWVRSDGVYELKTVTGDVYVFSSGSRNEIHLTKNLGLLKVVANGAVVWEVDEAPALRWPLERGRSGTIRTIIRSPLRTSSAGFSGSVDVAWTVGAVEDLRVAGGDVQAFRVNHVLLGVESMVRGATLGQITLWYSPSVQRFVKAETTLPLPGLAFEIVAPSASPVVALTPAPPRVPATPPVVAPGPVASPAPVVPSAPPVAAPPAIAAPAPVAPPAPRAKAAPPAAAPATLAVTPGVVPASPPAVAAVPPADTEAPRIVINYPPAEAKVEREEIMVLGLVTDNVAVDRVQVTVNGVEIPQPRETGEGRGRPLRVAATLRPGENVVEVTASDRAGNVSQVVRTVTRVVPTPAGPPPPKIANRWAVVIGVGEYEHESITKLRYATPDAEAMYQFLTTQGGYPKDNVLLLTDNTPQKPTLQNIRRALGDFLYRRPAREDMVLIYYAGHGAPEVDATGTEADGITKYLIPRNADPESLYSTALPMDEIQRIFSRIQSERVVLLLDTCYSGTAGGRTFARQQLRSSNLNDHFLDRLTRSKGRVIITAAGPNEVALETSELGHGVFTYYLLEGLRGKADRDGDGIVTVSELYEYVEQQVDRKARSAGGRQRPLMKGEIEGTLPLSRVGR
jgi:hypothetical protein